VTAQQRLELFDLAVVNGTLRQRDNSHLTDLVVRGDERPIDQVEIEPLRRRKLKEAERLVGTTLHGALERAKV
jgi:hypothetical protein